MGPFMDAYAIVHRPDNKMLIECLTSQIVYGEIYGTDECNIEWFGIKKAYIALEGCPYSNVRLMPNYKKYIERVEHVEFDYNIVADCYSVHDACESMVRNWEYMFLGAMTDERMRTIDTRNGKKFSIKETLIPKAYKLLKLNEFGEDIYFKGLWKNATVKPSMNKYETYTVDIKRNNERPIFDNVGAENCVVNTIKTIFQIEGFDWFETYVKSCHIKSLVYEHDIFKYLLITGVNFCIFKGKQGILYQFNETKTIHFIELTTNKNYLHVTLVSAVIVNKIKRKKTYINYKEENKINCIGKEMSIEEFLICHYDIHQSGQDEIFDIDTNRIKNLRHRLEGRVDLIMQRNKGFIQVDYMILTKQTILIEKNLLSGDKCYITMTGNKSRATLVGDYSKYNILFVEDSELFNGIILIPGITIVEKKLFSKQIIKKKMESVAFLNKISKNYSIANNLDDRSFKIDCYAELLIIHEYDNRKHHNENLVDIVNGKPSKGLIMSKWWDEERKSLLKLNGMIRLTVSNDKPKITWMVEQDLENHYNILFSNELMQIIENNDVNQVTLNLRKLLQNSKNFDWIERNELFYPQTDKLKEYMDELRILLRNDELTMTNMKTITKNYWNIDIKNDRNGKIGLTETEYEGEFPSETNNYGNYGNDVVHIFKCNRSIIMHMAGAGKQETSISEKAEGNIIISEDKARGPPMKYDFKENEERDTPREIPEQTKKDFRSSRCTAK